MAPELTVIAPAESVSTDEWAALQTDRLRAAGVEAGGGLTPR